MTRGFGGGHPVVTMAGMYNAMPVPYAGAHNGPKRILRLRLRRGLVAQSGVTVDIDGSHYHQPWGRTAFEIPADRPVHVAVTQGSGQVGLATVLLTPDQPPELEYRGPAALYLKGSIGAPGTVRQRGCLIQLVLISLAVLLAVCLVVLIAST